MRALTRAHNQPRAREGLAAGSECVVGRAAVLRRPTPVVVSGPVSARTAHVASGASRWTAARPRPVAVTRRPWSTVVQADPVAAAAVRLAVLWLLDLYVQGDAVRIFSWKVYRLQQV